MSDPATDKRQAMSLAFMRSHPAAAARVLEALPATEAGALFARAPVRLGATVLAAMLPNWAALCLGPLDNPRALELLSQMGTQPAVAVLRHLPAARRTALAAGLPTAVALATTALLGYGEDALGAWADPDIVMLPAETRAGHALDHFRLATSPHAWVFVCGRRCAATERHAAAGHAAASA